MDDAPAGRQVTDIYPIVLPEWTPPVLGEIAVWDWREQNSLCPMCSEPANRPGCGAVFCAHCGYECDCSCYDDVY